MERGSGASLTGTYGTGKLCASHGVVWVRIPEACRQGCREIVLYGEERQPCLVRVRCEHSFSRGEQVEPFTHQSQGFVAAPPHGPGCLHVPSVQHRLLRAWRHLGACEQPREVRLVAHEHVVLRPSWMPPLVLAVRKVQKDSDEAKRVGGLLGEPANQRANGLLEARWPATPIRRPNHVADDVWLPQEVPSPVGSLGLSNVRHELLPNTSKVRVQEALMIPLPREVGASHRDGCSGPCFLACYVLGCSCGVVDETYGRHGTQCWHTGFGARPAVANRLERRPCPSSDVAGPIPRALRAAGLEAHGCRDVRGSALRKLRANQCASPWQEGRWGNSNASLVRKSGCKQRFSQRVVHVARRGAACIGPLEQGALKERTEQKAITVQKAVVEPRERAEPRKSAGVNERGLAWQQQRLALAR
eukprot:scaffold42954_cov74-Phaeocystis_antarctica.AAC.11